jgi:vesicle-fusing ATPase
MNIRESLFGQGPKPGRQQPGSGRPQPSQLREDTPMMGRYDDGQRGQTSWNASPRPREDTPMMGRYDDGQRGSVGQASLNGSARPRMSSARYATSPSGPASPSRKLQLRIAKVEDKTLASQYIFSNR